MKKLFKINNSEVKIMMERSRSDCDNEIHHIKESWRAQLFEIKQDFAEKLKLNQDKIDSITGENERIRKELSKNKNFEEVKALHQKLESLRKASFQELISIKKERDDMYTKVQFLEKELSKAKKKIRATQSEVSKNRDVKPSKGEEELKEEVKEPVSRRLRKTQGKQYSDSFSQYEEK